MEAGRESQIVALGGSEIRESRAAQDKASVCSVFTPQVLVRACGVPGLFQKPGCSPGRTLGPVCY